MTDLLITLTAIALTISLAGQILRDPSRTVPTRCISPGLRRGGGMAIPSQLLRLNSEI
jgi:hypothetical protein